MHERVCPGHSVEISLAAHLSVLAAFGGEEAQLSLEEPAVLDIVSKIILNKY